MSMRTSDKGFGVSASPLNPIKLQLIVLLLGALLLGLVLHLWFAESAWKLVLLLLYSLISMLWVVLKTRTTLRQYQRNHESS